MIELNDMIAAHNKCMFNNILKFTDIAGKVVLHKHLHYLLGDIGDLAPHEPVELLNEVVDQERNIIAPFRQWW